MDVLDNYKKAWNNQPEDANKVSKIDIYKMAHSRSSSIVKWIFIIGVLEFIVLNSMYFFVDNSKLNDEYNKLGLTDFYNISLIVSYIIIFYFLIKFYLNYKSISTVDSTKVLMKKILITRKTVRNYVLFNLVFVAFLMTVIVSAKINFNIDNISTKQIWVTIIFSFIVTFLFLALLYGVYQLIYGILLRKLNRNYKELVKLDT